MMAVPRVSIRPMRSDDADDVRDLDRLILGDDRSTTWDAQVARFLELTDYGALSHPPLGCLVARQSGNLLGFILSEVHAGEYGLPGGAWVVAVGVHPDARRQGIGKMLVEGLREQCEANGISNVYAVLKSDDGRGVRFLNSCGLGDTPVVVLGSNTSA